MATVTVYGGASGSIETVTFLTADALSLAQTLANAINIEPLADIQSFDTAGTHTVAGATNAVILNAPAAAGASTLISASGQSLSIIGGSAGTTISTTGSLQAALAGGNNTVLISGSGTSSTVIAGAGNDSVYFGGSGSVDVGAGTNTVNAAGGADSVLAYGTGDVIFASAGNSTISEFGSGALIDATGIAQIVDGGTNDTVIAGGSADTVFGGTQTLLFLNSGAYIAVASSATSGSDTIVSSGAGSETVFGGTSDAIFTGSSNLTYIANGGGSGTISGGNGADTVFASNGSRVFYYGASGGSSPSTADLVGGSGNSTINAFSSTAGVNFTAGSGNSVMVGGTGNDTFFGGSGSDTFIGGGGSNTFAFVAGRAGGNVTIYNFSPMPLDTGHVIGFASPSPITNAAAPADSNDTLVLTGYGSNEVANALASETLVNGNETLTLPDGTKITFISNPNLDVAAIGTTACFASGTRMRTRSGSVAVETLQAGDLIDTPTGPQPIRWVGRRQVNIAAHPHPDRVRPIRIARDALADGVPARDLLVSPDHALFLDGVLVAAKDLVNGAGIAPLDLRMVTYFHVELAQHGVIFAEDVAVESYLDTGNRNAFENAGPVVRLHPDFAQARRQAESFAPLCDSGPEVERIRLRLLSRADIETTEDPDLHVERDANGVLLRSRSFVPGELSADPRDRRRLGLKLASLHIGGTDIPLDHPALVEGWQAPEPDGRWTDGAARVPASLCNPGLIAVTVAASGSYPVTSAPRATAKGTKAG